MAQDEEKKDKKRPYIFTKPTTILVIGKKGSGKTNLIRNLLLKNTVDHKYFRFGIVFTKTKYDGEYDYLPDEVVVGGWDIGMFNQYVLHLEQLKEQHGDEMPPNFVILDDLMGYLTESQDFINFCSCIRHLNCTLLLSAQYLRRGVSTTLRENMEMAFMFRSRHGLTLQALYEAFGQLFDRFIDFKEMFKTITSKKYDCLLYMEDGENMEECYKYYRAPDMSNTTISLEF